MTHVTLSRLSDWTNLTKPTMKIYYRIGSNLLEIGAIDVLMSQLKRLKLSLFLPLKSFSSGN